MNERQVTRVDVVRKYLDDMLKGLEDKETTRNGYVHLYGVGQAAVTIALKRGHSRELAELAMIAGMLHDWSKYEWGSELDHSHECAEAARAVMEKAGCFTPEEMGIVVQAIDKHSDKTVVDSAFDEILKDADALQHYLRNPMEDYWFTKSRIPKLLEELGLDGFLQNPM